MRALAAVSIAILLSSCGSAPGPKAGESKAVAKAKITRFYATDSKIPKGLNGSLCYSVENAKRLTLDPPVEEVWPAVTRCFEVSPTKNTKYTLTAYGEDGSSDSKSVEVGSAAAPPRLYDLVVNSVDVGRGQPVQICFKVENTTNVKVSAGKLDRAKNCLNDTPTKTTTYKITALGGDREMDSGTITVKVH